MGVVYTQPSMQERRSIQDQWRAYCSVTSLRSSTRSNALSGPVMPFLRNTQDPLGGRLTSAHDGGDQHNANSFDILTCTTE